MEPLQSGVFDLFFKLLTKIMNFMKNSENNNDLFDTCYGNKKKVYM
jgi:hypothetical protein